MGNSFKIGRAFDIDVKVHWTFFLLLLFFGVLGYLGPGGAGAAVITIGLILVLFVCVVLHEFGHALVGQRLGTAVQDITILPIGGVARFETLPEKPSDEIKIAVAGPLVNVALAPIFFGLALLAGQDLTTLPSLEAAQQSPGAALFYLGVINVALVVFNMIPAFPLDGGRVLRGLLAIRFGAVKATDISSAIGQGLAFGLFLVGLLAGNFILALIAVFIFFGASGESQVVRQREMTRGFSVEDVMGTRPHTDTVTPDHNFGQVLDLMIHGYQSDFPVTEGEDRGVVGMLTRNEIFAAANSPDSYKSVRDLMKTEFPTVSPRADLFEEGQKLLQESGLRALPVVEDGRLVGMLTTDDVSEASLLRDRRELQY